MQITVLLIFMWQRPAEMARVTASTNSAIVGNLMIGCWLRAVYIPTYNSMDQGGAPMEIHSSIAIIGFAIRPYKAFFAFVVDGFCEKLHRAPAHRPYAIRATVPPPSVVVVNAVLPRGIFWLAAAFDDAYRLFSHVALQCDCWLGLGAVSAAFQPDLSNRTSIHLQTEKVSAG
jgi:hypothetical protein